MACKDGIPLKRHLRGKCIGLSAFFSLAIQLVRILGRFHEKGIVLGALKSDMICISPHTGRVRLAGHGNLPLAAAFVPESAAYLSPEQIGQFDQQVDHRSDFYALGVVLYELLTRQLPFTAQTTLQWIYVHIAQEPVPPAQKNVLIPVPLSSLIMKLLAKSPAERYQSAGALLTDLRECRRQWRSKGVIQPFLLGRMDIPGPRASPDRCHNPDTEAFLAAALDRVCAGRSGFLLLEGEGVRGEIGPVRDRLRAMAVGKAYFTSVDGRQTRHVSYGPFLHAVQNLLQQFLTESEERFAAWQNLLNQTLDPRELDIIRMVPELTLFKRSLAGDASSPREYSLRRELRSIIGSIARVAPLIIFIEDICYADRSTVSLLRDLMRDTPKGSLMLVGACSADTVRHNRPLQSLCSAWEKAGFWLARLLISGQGTAGSAVRKNQMSAHDAAGAHNLLGEAVLPTMQEMAKLVYEGTEPAAFFQRAMEMVLRIAGADRGCIILNSDKPENAMIKEMTMRNGTAEIKAVTRDKADIPWSMVRFVFRTRETVVLSDADNAGIFTGDPCFAHSRAKGVLCLPLLFLNRPDGVLYLENKLLEGVFTSSRLDVLKLMAVQITYAVRILAWAETGDRRNKPRPAALIEPLTKRETDILRMIAAGMSNKEIAGQLKLTLNTVKTHILNIYGKLRVNKRVHAVNKAGELQLLTNE
ncbi:MAG TPA: LuxR C-terminal-related transcriptional regulator [Negativicutes bacterium]|nr:LuxR C-terminal-related transcriptional regulator [Negativicutes bacterium]